MRVGYCTTHHIGVSSQSHPNLCPKVRTHSTTQVGGWMGPTAVAPAAIQTPDTAAHILAIKLTILTWLII